MNRFIKYIILVLFLLFLEEIYAQQFHLKITTKDSLNLTVLNTIHFKETHTNSKSVNNEVKNISQQLSKIGYFNNSYNLKEIDSTINCEFTLNKKIAVIRVYYDSNMDTLILKKFKNINITQQYFETSTSQIEAILNSIVKFNENNGFTFSSVHLNHLKEENNVLIANLNIELSKKRSISKVIIKGYPNFPKKYLKHYIGINPDAVFNRKKLASISDLLNQIPFITQVKKPAVLFNSDSTSIFLYLKKKSNNNFDGIIGFTNEASSNKIQFNGYVDLNLNNIFNTGENLKLNWKSFNKSSKSLNVQFKAPYIFNTAITPNFEFSIFKQDSTYLNSKTAVSLQYDFNRNTNFNIIYNGEKSNLNQNNQISPNFKAYNNTYYGASFSYFKKMASTNFIPFKFLLAAKFLVGNRKTTIEKEYQNKIKFQGTYAINFNQRHSIVLKTENAILNSNKYYLNELYRVGGINSIHGFDEQSIFTSKYSLSTISYYYTINQRNAIYTITDFAITKDIEQLYHKLYSIGFGIIFQNKENTLNLSYALGKNDKDPFNFRDSKFHFKIIYPF